MFIASLACVTPSWLWRIPPHSSAWEISLTRRSASGVVGSDPHADSYGAKDQWIDLVGHPGNDLFGIFRGIAHWPAALLFSVPHPSARSSIWTCAAPCISGLLEIVFVFLFVDSVRQRRHAGGGMRARRLREGWPNPASRKSSAGGRHRHHGRRLHGHLHGHQLHRKRRGSGSRCAHRAEQCVRGSPVRSGGVLRPYCSRDPRLCDRPRLDPGRRAHDPIHRQIQWADFTEAFPAFITVWRCP